MICCVFGYDVSPSHYDIIKWNHIPRYWPFVKRIHRSSVESPHKGQWRGALMFSLICAWTKGSTNNRIAGDLWRHRAHYDVTVMLWHITYTLPVYLEFCDQQDYHISIYIKITHNILTFIPLLLIADSLPEIFFTNRDYLKQHKVQGLYK